MKPSILIDVKKLLSKNQQLWLSHRHHIQQVTAVIIGSDAGCLVFFGLGWATPITHQAFKSEARSNQATAELLRNYLTNSSYRQQRICVP